MRRLPLLGVLALVVAAPLSAPAQPKPPTDEAVEKAKEAFERGVLAYDQKKYADAAREFDNAYAVKPFSDFLYNAGLAYEKLGDKPRAIERFEKYLRDNPKIKDGDKVEKKLAALKGTTPAPEPGPVKEEQLKGVLYVDSSPAGANVYVDNKKDQPVGTTPWNGSFEGQHTVIIEAKGYKQYSFSINVQPGKVYNHFAGLSQEPNLAWVEIRANVPGASVFIDDHASGEVGRTPYLGNITKGKHKLWVSKDGFVEDFREVDLEGGKAYPIAITLLKGTAGFFYVTGKNVEGAKVLVDSKIACEKAPCRFQAPQGKRVIEVQREGYKTYTREQDVVAATETTLNVSLAEQPSRLDVLWNFGFAAVFLTGGVVLGLQSNSIHNEIQDDIASGKPPVFPNDSRFTKGKIFAIAADAAFAIGTITAITGVVSLLLEKGAPSTAIGESRDLGASITPVVGPGFAGVSAGVRW
jgi:tetratricopeptide (TPR) repeat protein